MLQEAKTRPLSQCLRAEFRAVQRFVSPPSDFFEGIRAALVDKDRKPQWSTASNAQVGDALLAEYFTPLESGRELEITTWPGFTSV